MQLRLQRRKRLYADAIASDLLDCTWCQHGLALAEHLDTRTEMEREDVDDVLVSDPKGGGIRSLITIFSSLLYCPPPQAQPKQIPGPCPCLSPSCGRLSPESEFSVLGSEDEFVGTKNIKSWTSYHQAGGFRFIFNITVTTELKH